ncbi:DUF6585 family protein [Actinomadura adrarensis]|uniref:DUF6585 family protein n=1 Tax=Actinomadura adrarensis TaxID=1819600 RepID=A0ABW3CN61_9ACTN
MGETESPGRVADAEFGALTDTFPAKFREKSKKKALVYERGLVLIARSGKTRRFPFGDVRVQQEIVEKRLYGFRASTAYRFVLTGPDGHKKVLTNFGYRRIDELGRTIQGHVVRAQLPGVLAGLQRGEQIEFGKLCLSKDGIGTRRRLLAWDEIGAVKFEEGYVVVAPREGRLNIAAAVKAVPNVFVLLAVVEQVMDARGR